MPTNSTELLTLYADEHLLAVDKPSGVPSQPDLSRDPSVLDLLIERKLVLSDGSGLLHRLDRPVSGVLLFARTPEAARAMNALFRGRRIVKTYWAIVEGAAQAEGVCEQRLERSAQDRKARTVASEEGKAISRLRYTRLAVGERFTLLEVRPEGGGFHQIRAQLSASGMPIKGDVKYGARRGEADRSIALHARTLSFIHPFTGISTMIEAPDPVRSIWPALLALRAT